MLKWAQDTAESVGKYAATTSLGQSYVLKPKVLEKIQAASSFVSEETDRVSEFEILKDYESVVETLDSFKEAAESLVEDISQDETLDPIIAILANQLSKFDTIEDFRAEALEASTGILDYLKGLMSTENYKELLALIENIENYETLKPKQQKSLISTLEKGALIADIEAENKKLNLKAVQKDVEKEAKKIFKKFELSKDEQETIITTFHTLVKDHLPQFDELRKSLIKEGKPFLDAQLERLKEGNDDVAESALKVDSTKAVTPQKNLKQKRYGRIGVDIGVAADDEPEAKKAKKAKTPKQH